IPATARLSRQGSSRRGGLAAARARWHLSPGVSSSNAPGPFCPSAHAPILVSGGGRTGPHADAAGGGGAQRRGGGGAAEEAGGEPGDVKSSAARRFSRTPQRPLAKKGQGSRISLRWHGLSRAAGHTPADTR